MNRLITWKKIKNATVDNMRALIEILEPIKQMFSKTYDSHASICIAFLFLIHNLFRTLSTTVSWCAPPGTCEQRRRHKLQPDPSLGLILTVWGSKSTGGRFTCRAFCLFCLLYAAFRQRCKMDEEASDGGERRCRGGWVADLVGSTEFHEFDQFGGRAY